jgi:glycosyltransferase involved in cell wall biosynthesis
MKGKIIFINTHPIQYFAPLYREINKSNLFKLKVIFLSDHGIEEDFDNEFNSKFKWDIPLTEGYDFEILKNISLNPGVYKGFFGIINFSIFRKLFFQKKSIIIVHGWSPLSCFISIIISKLFGHITCLRAETPLIHELKKNKIILIFRKILFKYFLFNFVDYFLYIGNQNKKFYKFYGVNSSKLIFTPYSVNNDKFTNLYHKNINRKLELKKELGFNLKKKIILFSGKLINKKNPVDLLRSVISLNRKDLFIVFMGDGLLRKKINEVARKNNFINYNITGFINQSEIYKYYLISDLFVMCSGEGETWGLSTNEAMNFNLPIIISDMTGCSSDLVNKNGFVFARGNIDELSKKLNKFFSLSERQINSMKNESGNLIKSYSYTNIIEGLKMIK